jgi:hypothetical protein
LYYAHAFKQARAAEGAFPSADALPPSPQDRMGEAARKALSRATVAVKRYGWIGFWVQLTLSVISAVILLFSVAFTSQVSSKQHIGHADCRADMAAVVARV